MCTDAIELTIVTDATFSEETKTTGIAAVLLDETGQPRLVCGKQIETCNIVEGELRAILFALEEIPDDGAKLLLQSDNKNSNLHRNRTIEKKTKMYSTTLVPN